jgi:hypothetical protein
MNKEIKINPELFSTKKNKTIKKPVGSNLKKELLKTLASKESDVLKDLEQLTSPEIKVEPDPKPELVETSIPKPDTEYGCLKNGTKPTFRQLKNKPKTIKQYASFGKHKDTVRVLIKDKEMYAKIEKDKKKIDKHNMTDIRNYLRTRKLYKIGSTAPDEVLREIYKNAYLTGNVENNSSETLVHNYLNEPV